MSVILCSGSCGALMPATTLPASVRNARLETSRPVGVSSGMLHVPISGAASAGVSGVAAPAFGAVPAAPALGAGVVAPFVAGVAALVPVAVCAAMEPLIASAATIRHTGILRSMYGLLRHLDTND